jgi:hypothetical protein
MWPAKDRSHGGGAGPRNSSSGLVVFQLSYEAIILSSSCLSCSWGIRSATARTMIESYETMIDAGQLAFDSCETMINAL